MIQLALEQLAPGHKTKLIGEEEGDKGVPFPAAIAVLGSASAEKLLVAENLLRRCAADRCGDGEHRASLRSC